MITLVHENAASSRKALTLEQNSAGLPVPRGQNDAEKKPSDWGCRATGGFFQMPVKKLSVGPTASLYQHQNFLRKLGFLIFQWHRAGIESCFWRQQCLQNLHKQKFNVTARVLKPAAQIHSNQQKAISCLAVATKSFFTLLVMEWASLSLPQC